MNTKNNPHLGAKIKSLIEASQHSVKDVAELMDTSFQNIYRILEKESVETKHLFKLAEILRIPVTQFFEESSVVDLSQEVESYKELISKKDNEISQLQNQITILEKLVKSNETIIQKQETINELFNALGKNPKIEIDTSDPLFEKYSELAKKYKNATSFLDILIQIESDPEMKDALVEMMIKK